MPANKPTACDRPTVDLCTELRKLAHHLCTANGCTPRDPIWIHIKGIPETDAMISALADEAVAKSDVARYALLSQIRALYSKNPGFAGDSAEKKCLESFYQAERMCVRTNRRIALTARGKIGRQYYAYLEAARRHILRIIGPRPVIWSSLGKHGNGSAIGCNGRNTTPVHKNMSIPYNVTDACYAWFLYLIDSSPIWRDLVDPHPRTRDITFLKVVPSSNKFSFVPKNWKTHRGICVEPVGNIYVQQALGREISHALKRVGINIFEGGQDKHRDLARIASLQLGDFGNSPVTLDLSMASDTLSTELVRYLLPDEWFQALDCARCHSTTMPNGTVVRTSKFSSMGNAATFPLETLIFYTLAMAVSASTKHAGPVMAYGDDIIVPRGTALLLSEVLRWCGFKVNPEKSFILGDFYESCGADYLRGVLVRPFYIKRSLRSLPDWFFVCNAARDARYIAFSAPGVNDYIRNRCALSNRGSLLFGPEVRHEEHGIPDCWIETDDRLLWKTRRLNWVLQVRGLAERTTLYRVPDEPSALEALRTGGSVGRLENTRESAATDAFMPPVRAVKRFLTRGMKTYEERWIRTIL